MWNKLIERDFKVPATVSHITTFAGQDKDTPNICISNKCYTLILSNKFSFVIYFLIGVIKESIVVELIRLHVIIME